MRCHGPSGTGHADRFSGSSVLAVGSNVDLDVRPPHMHASERLHADYSDVRQVQHVEDSVMFRLMIVRMRPESGNSTYVTGRRPTRAREVQ